MRYFRRLPPLLRVARIMGYLFPLVMIVLVSVAYFTGQSASTSHLWAIWPNLLLLSLACAAVATAYSTRVGRPAFGPFPLDSWQSQVRVIALLWVLPLGDLALAFVIPATSRAYLVVLLGYVLAGGVLVATFIAFRVGYPSNGPMHTPPTA